MALTPTGRIKVEVTGARGKSFADIARQAGSFDVLPTDSDAQVNQKFADYAIQENIGFQSVIPGPANNTYSTLAALRASDPSQRKASLSGIAPNIDGELYWDADETTPDDGVNYFESTFPGVTTGAWVRQDGDKVAFSHTSANGGSSVGARLAQDIYITDAPWNAKCDFDGETGTGTNDLPAILACIEDAPIGARIVIPGPALITDTLNVTKRVDLVCMGNTGAIIVDVGTTKDGIVIGPGTGPGGAYGRSYIHLNVYGGSDCCRNGIVLRRVDRSQLELNVSVGTIQTEDGLAEDAGFGVVLDGCLQNEGYIQSSVNYRPPFPVLVTAFQKNHLLVTKNEIAPGSFVPSNATYMWLNFEGGGHGMVAREALGEGKSEWAGIMQGLEGHPLHITSQTAMDFRNIWFEANNLRPYFFDCKFIKVTQTQLTGKLVAAIPGSPTAAELAAQQERATMLFENCLRPEVDLIYGEAEFDENTVAPIYNGTLTQFVNQMPRTGETFYDAAEQRQPSFGIDRSDITYGGEGAATLANQFVNPFVDLWPDGLEVFSVPGIAGGPSNTILAKEDTAVFPQGPGIHARATIGTAGATKGALIAMGDQWAGRTRWISFMLLLRLRDTNTAGKKLRIRVGAADDVAGMRWFCDVSEREVFAVRGGFAVDAGKEPAILVTMHDGTAYTTGVFDIGGVSLVNGPRAPKYVEDSTARRSVVVGATAAAPAYRGQIAVVSDVGYMATGTSSAADWKQITA